MWKGSRITVLAACLLHLVVAAAVQAQIIENGDFGAGAEGWTWTGLPESDWEWDCSNEVTVEEDEEADWLVLRAGGCIHAYGGADPLTGHTRLFQTLEIPVEGVYELTVRFYHLPAMCCDVDQNCWPTSTLTVLLGAHEITLSGHSEWLESEFELELPAGELELQIYLRGGDNWDPYGVCWVSADTVLDRVALEALTTSVAVSHWSTVQARHGGGR